MKVCKLLSALLLFSAILTGCGGGSDDEQEVTEPQPPPAAAADPLEAATEAVLTTSGAQEQALNPAILLQRWTLAGASFSSDVTISVNGEDVAQSAITRTATEVSAQLTLTDGRNTVSFKAYDQDGRPLFKHQVLWSGSHKLAIQLVDEKGQPFTQNAEVSLRLADDAAISAAGVPSAGTVTFDSLPARTVLVQARAAGNLFGVAGGVGNDGAIIVRLVGFSPASGVANNDFSQGASGWNVSASSASVVAHEEDAGPSLATSQQIEAQPKAVRSGPDARQNKKNLNVVQPLAAGEDADLKLDTVGQGAQSLSRVFAVAPGTTAVVVRYRFVTSEVPGGYFGSQYNDYFSVTIRSKTKGLVATESNTMNGLGLAAFNATTGSTAWRTVTINTDPQSDEVQVDVSVANVADGALDSSVIVDYVAEKQDKVVPTLAWSPTDGGLTLSYKVESGPLAEPVTVRVHWASGTTAASAIGGAMFSLTVPAGTAAGEGPSTSVKGDFLSNDPAGVTHLIAIASETSLSSVKDVAVGFGANANAAAVPSAMLDIVRDALRAAGTVSANITSTARTPADQARAMFNNLVNPNNTMAVNIQNQLALYAAPGDAVVGVFTSQSAGKTLQQVLDSAAVIKSAMEAEIIAQGPTNVSKHCADPAIRSVIDVGASAFAGTTSATAFKTTATARVDKFIDEISTNNAYHLELAIAQ